MYRKEKNVRKERRRKRRAETLLKPEGEGDRFWLGKNEFLVGIVVPSEDGPGQTDPPPHIWSPFLARRSERRKEVATLAGDFSEKVPRQRNDPGGEKGAHNIPSVSPRLYPTCPFFLPHVRDARRHAKCNASVMQNGRLLIASRADTRIVPLNGPLRSALRTGEMRILIVITKKKGGPAHTGRDNKFYRRQAASRGSSRARGCTHFRIK